MSYGVCSADAQDVKPKTQASAGDDTVVVVTGFRASLQKSLSVKRKSDIMLDAINAEDIGKFPDSNLAEALQRLPGISIQRDNGEGRTITVRGLGGDFVRTRLNGIETVAQTGTNEGQSQVAKSRTFDYNVFATDLFSSLKVLKSAQASIDEGSLGATVDIDTGHPLDFRKRKIAFSIQDAYYSDYAKNHRNSPRFAGLYSDLFFGGKLGFSISGAYSTADKDISDYNRNQGAFEYNYRGSPLLGVNPQNGTGGTATPTCLSTAGVAPTVNSTTNSSPLNCYWGFALPTNLRTSGPTSLGIDSNSLMFGSDPTAYSIITPTTIIPALIGLQQQDQKQKRIGLTSSLQWKPNENTKITFDALYAGYDNSNDGHLLSSFGLNRHGDTARAEIGLTNSSTGLRPYATTNNNYFVDRRAAYANVCNPAAATATAAALDCTGTLGNASTPVFSTAQYWNGTAYVTAPSILGTTNTTLGNTWSTNPYNLDTYDYYNNPGSVGYNAAAAAADHRGITYYDQLVGHEHTAIVDAHVNSAGRADYLKLNRLDWISQDQYNSNNTNFTQYDFTLDQRWSETLKMQFVYGASFSHLRSDGGRTDAYALDKDGFVFDERATGTDSMPIIQTGFNAADPNQFAFTKGMAGVSRYVGTADNTFQNARLDFNYWTSERLNFDFGLSSREFGYSNTYASFSRSVVPTVEELNKYGRDKGDANYANLTIAGLGHLTNFGAGLDLPSGTTTSWWTPDAKKVDAYLHYTCNCVNQFGDWRVNPSLGSGLSVNERDNGAYAQANFNFDVFGRTLRGNTGVRVVTTHIESASYGTTGIFNGKQLQGSSQYTDTLPSLNLGYEVTDTFMIRFAAAKTMSRPDLNLLGPGVTSLSISATPSSSAVPSIKLGNPELKPFRSTNYDLNFEWYFNKDSLVSVAFYQKNLSSFPRVETYLAKLSGIIPADLHTQIRNSLTPDQQAYMDGDDTWTVTSAANSPGGVVNGIELQYQQPLTFLPAPFDGFGIQANATHIQSKLSYLTSAGVRATGPWPYASPHSLNLTLYYEKGPWQARISGSWRERYASKFPQASGTCSPGLLTSNGGVCTDIYNDFQGTESQTYWDFKGSYKVSQHINIDLSVQNILGQDAQTWVYTNPSSVLDYRSNGGAILTTALRFIY
jgi:TonB-dependent receptor